MHDTADAFTEISVDGTIRDWSTRAAALFGWSAQEAIGKQLDALLLSPSDQTAWQHGLRQCIKSGSKQMLKRRMELLARHKDGSELPVEFTVSMMDLHGGVYFTALIRDISLRRTTERALNERIDLLNLCPEAIVATGVDGRIEFWNTGAEQLYGYLAEEALGHKWQERIALAPGMRIEEIERELAAKGRWEGELQQLRRDGAALTTLCRWSEKRGGTAATTGLLMVNCEPGMGQRVRETAVLLRESEQRFNTLFEHHTDGVFSFNSLFALTAANSALSEMTGYEPAELRSMSLAVLVAPKHLTKVRTCFLEAMQGKPQTCEICCVKKNGEMFDARIAMLPNMHEGKVVSLHGIVKDISFRKINERRIRHLANHDGLTGLPNRNLLEERTKHALEHAKRLGCRVGVLFLDLNRFKVINDSLGHEIGDQLLCALAKRLQAAVREVDTVARLGGDEFVVLLEDLHEFEQITRVADSLLRAVRQPIELGGHFLSVSTSIGASIFPNDGQDAVALFKNADLAMYAAKAAGDGVFRLYDPEMNAKAVERLIRENSLRQALDQGYFVLHYQPRLDIASNTIVSVEALVRWTPPGKGLVYPAGFIPLAEEIGLIQALGKWVLRTACHQLKAWQQQQLPTIKISVNLSVTQLIAGSMRDTISQVLAETGLDASYLELEITESCLMQDLNVCARILDDIRALGVSLSIDDFGTGYSSLAYLKRLPIHTLKIDQSFIAGIPYDSDDAAIVTATIAMAHSMDLRVVAEGVTSYAQQHFLEECHCDEIQGYLLCQPLPAEELALFLRTSELRGISTKSPERRVNLANP
jgi:diguanylate cyclase (GGDEF)-like protein/PAS domain S-box-containing protein